MQGIIPQRIESRVSPGTGITHTIFLYVGVSLFVLVVSGYAALFFLNKKGGEVEERLGGEIRQKGEELRSGIGKEAAILERRLQKIRNLLDVHSFSSSAIRFVEARAHPQVRFMNFEFNEANQLLAVNAETQGFAFVAQQMGFLRNDPNVSKVEFGGLSLRDKGRVFFHITISFKPGFTKVEYKSPFGGVEMSPVESKIPAQIKPPVSPKIPQVLPQAPPKTPPQVPPQAPAL